MRLRDRELQRMVDRSQELLSQTNQFLASIGKDETMANVKTYCTCERSALRYHADTMETKCELCGRGPDPAKLDVIMPGTAKAALTAVNPEAVADGTRTEMEFIEELNPLCIWRLRDGSIIKVRMVLMHVERIEGCYNPDGTPLYDCGWQQVLYVVAPPELKRRP